MPLLVAVVGNVRPQAEEKKMCNVDRMRKEFIEFYVLSRPEFPSDVHSNATFGAHSADEVVPIVDNTFVVVAAVALPEPVHRGSFDVH